MDVAGMRFIRRSAAFAARTDMFRAYCSDPAAIGDLLSLKVKPL